MLAAEIACRLMNMVANYGNHYVKIVDQYDHEAEERGPGIYFDPERDMFIIVEEYR